MTLLVRTALLLLLVPALVWAAGDQRNEFLVEPTAGQLFVWEFVLDVDQQDRGDADRPPIESKASGVGRIEFDSTTGVLRYQFNWESLAGEVRDIELRGPAHAHQSTKRRLTTLARTVGPGGDGGHFGGEHVLRDQAQKGFDRLPVTSILTVMASGGAYVTVLTSAFEDGEIRGNLGNAVRLRLP